MKLEIIDHHEDETPTCWICGKTRALFFYEKEERRLWCLQCLVESWEERGRMCEELHRRLRGERERAWRLEDKIRAMELRP